MEALEFPWVEMSNMMSQDPLADLRQWLAEDGLIDPTTAELTPLSGGVSCDVVLVRDGGRSFVAKRALAKLRVKDDWFADVSRNRYEHAYMRIAAEVVPESVPEIIHVNDERGYFCMAWLGEGWENWKQQMLAGVCDTIIAAQAGRVLGEIHRHTAGRDDLAAAFDTGAGFHSLRLEPYLETTASRHPALSDVIMTESRRLAASRECLVHGDYSPKNILTREDQLTVLDCEVAWYGAACFDLAFLLNHFFLKALYHAPAAPGFNRMIEAAATAYFSARNLTEFQRDELDRQTAHLLPMLMLARIDGKSPVEYLVDAAAKKDIVRQFTTRNLSGQSSLTVSELAADWFTTLAKMTS